MVTNLIQDIFRDAPEQLNPYRRPCENLRSRIAYVCFIMAYLNVMTLSAGQK